MDDARFVALTARDAADRGAMIRTRTRVVAARRDSEYWTITLEDTGTHEREEVRARLLVNAAGPWADKVLQGVEGDRQLHNVRLVQGSHIVVRKKFSDPRSYFFQNNDGRIIFAIPYEDDFTLIGTTDQDYQVTRPRLRSPMARPTIFARQPANISRSRSDARILSGPIPACARFMMTVRARHRKQRAIMC